MKLPRRTFLHLAASGAALPAVSWIARAQDYPTRPVRIIVTFPSGGANDFHARLNGQWLSERLGQPFVVENRPGGGGSIGTEAVVRAVPDGHTLVLLSTGITISAAAYDNLSYDLVRDIAPVAGIHRSFYVMMVTPKLPVKTVSEFIAYAKANPGKLNMASNGVGATGHLAGEMFKMMTGVSMLHVPYRGEAPAITDLIAGQVDVIFTTVTTSLELVRRGQLRGLAVTSAARSPSLPDLPTVAETVPGYELSTWAGIGAPKNTPAEIVSRLNKETIAGLARPNIKAQYESMGLSVLALSPAEFGELIRDDIAKWAKAVKFAGIKPN
jgi:tripartite-type tricarboxylate transporter receptor subunit TctC